jgi:hypothetical protein
MRKIIAVFMAIALFGSLLTAMSLVSAAPAKAAGGPSLEAGVTVPVNVGGGSTGGGGGVGLPGPGSGGSGGGSGGGGGGGTTLPSSTWYKTLSCPIAGQTYRDGVSCTVFAQYSPDGGGMVAAIFTCAPRGGTSAYAVVVRYVGVASGPGYGNGQPTAYTCQYPSAESKTPIVISRSVCYYNYSGQYYYSATKSAIAGGGTYKGSRNPNHEGGDPAGGAACSANPSMNYKANAGDYGYYRIEASLNYRTKTIWGYQSWRNDPTTWVEWSGVSGRNQTNYYAYSCSIGGTFQGPTTYGALPGNIAINAGDCAQANWQCKPQGTLDINNTHGNVSLMRDGNNVPFTAPQMVISGGGVRGYSGQSKVADSDTSYLISVNSGSTPSNSTNQNDAKQYYKLLKANGSSPESFGNWYSGANGNRSKFLNFYWSSDNGGTWSATRKVKFNGQFLVPRSTTIGGPITNTWVKGSASCADLQSNKATIVRSANG